MVSIANRSAESAAKAGKEFGITQVGACKANFDINGQCKCYRG